MTLFTDAYIDGLVQERRNSSAFAMELRLSCANPSICGSQNWKVSTNHNPFGATIAWVLYWRFAHSPPHRVETLHQYGIIFSMCIVSVTIDFFTHDLISSQFMVKFHQCSHGRNIISYTKISNAISWCNCIHCWRSGADTRWDICASKYNTRKDSFRSRKCMKFSEKRLKQVSNTKGVGFDFYPHDR